MRFCLNLNFRAGTLAGLFQTGAYERLAGTLSHLPWFSDLNIENDGFSISFFDGPTPHSSTRSGEIVVDYDRIDWVTPVSEIDFQQVANALEQAVQIAVKEGIPLGFWSGLLALDTPFERPRPPRNLGRIRQDAILDVFDPTSPDCPPEWPSLLEGIDQGLPPGTLKRSVGQLIVLDWMGGYRFSDEQLLASMVTRIDWFYHHAAFPLLGDFNQYGDELIPLVGVQSDPFYTFFQEYDGIGFKAIASIEDPPSKDDSLARIKSELELGATREGRRLSRVILILPTREQATAARDERVAEGNMGTAYPDSEGQLWLTSP